MAVFFLFLRNVLLQIEILKLKIPEHSDPPSQHFFVRKAFSHFYFRRGKVMLCHLAEWHTFLFSNIFVFGFFLVIHYFCLVLRSLLNYFWSRDLGTSGFMTSHLTLRPPEFSVLTKLES